MRMPIPGQPKSDKEPTLEMRRERTAESIRENLTRAVERIIALESQLSDTEIIKRMHFWPAHVKNRGETETELLRAYSLWDNKGLHVIPALGKLACPDETMNYERIASDGGDQLTIVSIDDLEKNNFADTKFTLEDLKSIDTKLSTIATEKPAA